MVKVIIQIQLEKYNYKRASYQPLVQPLCTFMALLEITGNSELTDIEFELFTTEKILVVQL